MTNEKTEKRISPYADRATAQKASARKYHVVGEELLRFFRPLQCESYLAWQEFWDEEEKAHECEERGDEDGPE